MAHTLPCSDIPTGTVTSAGMGTAVEDNAPPGRVYILHDRVLSVRVGRRLKRRREYVAQRIL